MVEVGKTSLIESWTFDEGTPCTVSSPRGTMFPESKLPN